MEFQQSWSSLLATFRCHFFIRFFAYHAQYLQKYTEVSQIHVISWFIICIFTNVLFYSWTCCHLKEVTGKKRVSSGRLYEAFSKEHAEQHAGSSTELQLLIQSTFYASDDSQCSFISFLQQQRLLWPFLQKPCFF